MPRVITIDVRCLQDEGYRDRGVGRLGANLVRSARTFVGDGQDCRVIGIVDPALPALDERFRIHFNEVRSTRHDRHDADDEWFIELSPMTHDPLFVARALDDERIFRSTIVYDFIPLRAPDQYLPKLAQKFEYQAKLRWLSRYDHFFPISNYTKTELTRLLDVPERRITVSPPPIERAFINSAAGSVSPSLSHILVVGGADRRKNVDCAIGAHARSWVGRNGGPPLLVLGGYPAEWQERLRGLYAREGGTQSQLTFLGYVADEELVALYRNAVCVVVPSRAEGFSIPVVEGMAVGTPVFASAIPAHQELIENSEFMFDTEDYMRLAYLLDRVVTKPGFRSAVIEDQCHRWQRFRADDIARQFWASLKSHATTRVAAPHIGGRRPQIAVVGPVPPDQSGVADYTAATFKELGKLADVYVFTPTNSPPTPAGAAGVAPISALPYVNARFDRVIGVMGNSHFHNEVFRLLMRFGGACIEHDNRLLGFYQHLFGEQRTTELAQRELGRPLLPGELNGWLADESTLPVTFLGELVERCRPFFVHSRETARLVHERFGIEATYLPFSIYREWRHGALTPASRAVARDRIGISRNEIVIVTLGYIAASKAPIDCIWALEVLHGWKIPAKLCFVGEAVMDVSPLVKLCDDLGLTQHVRFVSNYVAESDYRSYLLGADVAIQLRTHQLGGLSGAMLDCIAVGLPTVANRDLAVSMEAPTYVFPVPDRPGPVLIAEALATAITSGTMVRTWEDERRIYCDVHSFREYAKRLCAGLSLDPAPPAAAYRRR